MGSWLDGFAKLHTIKFDGKTAYFSGKMVESTTYMDSVRNKELVPMALLGTFENPEDEWNMMEIVEIMGKATDQFNGDLEHNFVRINVTLLGYFIIYVVQSYLPDFYYTNCCYHRFT